MEAPQFSHSQTAQSLQSRAHSLLKNKEAELRAVRESAESYSTAELSAAKSEAQRLQGELAQVPELVPILGNARRLSLVHDKSSDPMHILQHLSPSAC